MALSPPDKFSIAVADAVALGHVNTGLQQYRAFEAMALKERGPDEQLDFSESFQVGVPAVTNLALGLELLIKIHHFQITGRYPTGHKIQKLGIDFPPESLKILRAHYTKLYEDEKYPKGVQFRFSGGSTGEELPENWPPATPTYDSAIQYVGTMYVRWRYIYEEFGSTIDVSVSFAPIWFAIQSMRAAIREYKGNVRITLSDPNTDT